MTLGSLLPRIVVAAALLAACEDKDPLDSATNPTAVSYDPSAGPSAGPSGDMTEGTDTDPTDGTTTEGTTESVTEGLPTSGSTTQDDPTTGTADVSHDLDIQPIWDANCVTGCHTPGGTAATWFILSDGAAYDSLVAKQSISFGSLTLVEPNDLEGSYLWHKINGTHFEVGGGGTQMPPPPAAMLSPGDREKIGQWIEAGCAP